MECEGSWNSEPSFCLQFYHVFHSEATIQVEVAGTQLEVAKDRLGRHPFASGTVWPLPCPMPPGNVPQEFKKLVRDMPNVKSSLPSTKTFFVISRAGAQTAGAGMVLHAGSSKTCVCTELITGSL